MITEIKQNDRYAQQQLDVLLVQEGIRRDRNLDYTCGIFDDSYDLLATGSCFKNTIRCTAVAADHQGEGLLNQIMSHLMTVQAERGNSHVFVYTKPESSAFFADIGFYEIVRTDSVVFMENRRGGLDNWISELQADHQGKDETHRISAIVMNANPFTNGHRYLAERAARDSKLVHIFVVSEDAGPVPVDVRSRLVREGTADLDNVICHDSGDYIISSATFPGYFLNDEEDAVRAQAELDIKVFSLIAKQLGITVRYAGDEPYSSTTAIYNEIMKSHLPEAGIDFRELPRMEQDGQPVSASMVRRLIRESKDHEDMLVRIGSFVPPATMEYFRSEESENVISAIMREEAGKKSEPVYDTERI